MGAILRINDRSLTLRVRVEAAVDLRTEVELRPVRGGARWRQSYISTYIPDTRTRICKGAKLIAYLSDGFLQ